MDTHKYLKVGESLKKDFIVDETHTAEHLGSGAVKVLSTPMMIAYIEITARTLLDNGLPEGYSTVGTRVDVRHLAPTALGKTIRIEVEIKTVKNKKVTFSVSAWEGEKKVGEGIHDRYVIDVVKFLERANQE